jgi:hypothetical protein
MNLADLLGYADIHQLHRIAKNYQCECDGHSKNELIQAILHSIYRQESFERLWADLTIEDWRFIYSLLFDAKNTYSLEELMARAKQTYFEQKREPYGLESNRNLWEADAGGPNPREIITRFRQKGWLFNGVSNQTKYLFTIPNDLKERASQSLLRHISQKLEYADEVQAYRDEHQLLIDDIYRFLHYLYHHEVLLNSDSGIYKRQQQQMIDTFHVKEELVKKAGWRFGYGRRFKEYPDRFSFIYDYCYYSKLIEEGKGMQLILTATGQERVLDAMKENPMDVYRFWLRLYRGPIRYLEVILRFIDLVSYQKWITVQSLKSVLQQLIKPFYFDTVDSILDYLIVGIMLHLGLIRLGHTEAQGTTLQVTRPGHQLIQGIVIQDDEVIEISM